MRSRLGRIRCALATSSGAKEKRADETCARDQGTEMKTHIFTERELNSFLKDASQHTVCKLHISIACAMRIPKELPVFPRLQKLSLWTDDDNLPAYPTVLCASALPCRQSLHLCGPGSAISMYPIVLEGPFDQLQKLSIRGWSLFGEMRMAALFQSKDSPCFPRLTELSLIFNNMDAEACLALSRALQHQACPSLSMLSLSSNCIGADGCAALADAFKNKACPHLWQLDLGGNTIRAEGAMALADALKTKACPDLAKLKLDGNSIGAEGTEALASALQDQACPHLTHLNLRENNLRVQGCTALAKALQDKVCPDLIHLFLDSNEIGDHRCQALGKALRDQACPKLCNPIILNSPSWITSSLSTERRPEVMSP